MSDIKQIKTSPNDHRQYRHLTLKNGLSVLLVADEHATQSAASMAVAVGHFDDPVERPGMAHFLEHMLFLGTEKYPESGEYSAFINQHGGTNNAWTGTEHTNFFYSINADQFEASLDRFSQFFIAPLFNKDLVDRERHAIESEFSMKLKDDVRRVYQVQKETVNPAHPFSKFSVGNLKTLSGEESELRQELLHFYQQKYSANIMTLCLVAPQSLDQLTSLAEQYFSQIRNQQRTDSYADVAIYLPEQLQKQINIIPLKEQKRVAITFALPELERFYKHKPLTFISHLLGYEGKGSLLSYLKESGLANNLSAGGGVNGYNFKDYNISIQLTDRGLANLDEVISATFEYINLVKCQGLQTWRYDERAALLKIAFQYQEQVNALDLASHLSINMHHYDIEDVIFGDYRMDGLNLAETKALLALMTPANMRLQLIAPELDANKKAAWYHTPYQVQAISQQRLSIWTNTTVREQLYLPNKNPFIIDECIARPDKSNYPVPTVVAQKPGYRIWHRKDDEFNVPKGHLYLSLDSAQAAATPKQAALTRLYVEMLLDYLTEYTYQAEVAGLSYNIYPHQGGITLHLTGFTGKQETLLELVIEKARERNFTQSRFDLIKRQILRAWYNHSQAKPISQLFTSLTVTLQKRSFEPSRMAEILEEITLDDLHAHVKSFYEKIHLEGLVFGDWLESETHVLGERLERILSLVTTPSRESSRELINLSSKGTLLREIPVSHPDSSIIVYYQSDTATPENMALFSLLNHTMSSTFFHELRTKRQLGYMVGTGYLPLNRYPGIIFYIQSPTCGPQLLLEAIDEFIADFTYAVLQITNEQWEATKNGLVNQLLIKDSSLKVRSQRYWSSIGNKDYSFNQRELVAEQIKQLTRADLIKFIMQRMRTKHCDRLVLFSTGDSHHEQVPLESDKMITDLRAFKQESAQFEY
ncbi:insulinase family protein [Shewanella fidelis]|uniref:Protease 3 n=1 Tax=Shewanella fidelis TaxID=173509 RepID=A0AAW8NKZ7_9GAMM|nr:insulinase family protein [Shewanella fidelis]MDR8523351.1 insulinase family protein [Shewanella fidelis]MDW4813415.1 insulinase family protein [Shewanella fidelis]MDW4817213.1 insulinase family protein [Shewanella fidelis]MDW4821430.1 insulinase family protein [Shewanella fidelis]MDW4824492.1 insulinase family protein [Shewanella fidelis]